MPGLKLRETAAQLARLGDLKRHVKAGVHDRPGVYRMITESGEVAYVGKSKKLRTRLLSYFRAEYPGDKAARIVREAATIEWGYVPNEFAALLEEMRLIKSLRPRFNIALKRDARNYAFVRVTDGRAPRLTVVRGTGAGDRGGVYYGPFSGAVRLRDALRELSDALGLRDCTMDRQMRFADQPDLLALPPRTPGCIRFEIGTCLGPCVAAPMASVYTERVRQARAFLQGDDETPILRLQALMQTASDELQFERAAALRDKVQRLESLRDQFDRLRFAVESLTFSYRVPGHEGDDRVYLLRRGVVRAERRAPRTEEERAELRALAASVAAATEYRGSTVVPSHEVDELLIVSSWFTNKPEEVERTEAL